MGRLLQRQILHAVPPRLLLADGRTFFASAYRKTAYYLFWIFLSGNFHNFSCQICLILCVKCSRIIVLNHIIITTIYSKPSPVVANHRLSLNNLLCLGNALIFPLILPQIHTSIFFKQHSFLTKKFRLFNPSRHSSSDMVDNPVARVLTVLIRHTENSSDQPRVFLPANQPGNLPVGRNFSERYLINDRENLENQFFIHHNNLPRVRDLSTTSDTPLA